MQTEAQLPRTARPAYPIRRIAIAAALCLSAPAAFAQAFDVVRLLGAAPDRDSGRIGAVAIAAPKYITHTGNAIRFAPDRGHRPQAKPVGRAERHG